MCYTVPQLYSVGLFILLVCLSVLAPTNILIIAAGSVVLRVSWLFCLLYFHINFTVSLLISTESLLGF